MSGCNVACSLTYPFATSCANASATYARARRRLSMFPQYGVLISRISDIKKCSHEHRESDRTAAERQDPFNEWTRSSKYLAADHHPALPPVELINRNQISDREREIESAKK